SHRSSGTRSARTPDSLPTKISKHKTHTSTHSETISKDGVRHIQRGYGYVIAVDRPRAEEDFMTTAEPAPTMTIDGKQVAGEATFDVVDPATGEAFAQAPAATVAQVDAAMEAAQRAQVPWAQDETARQKAMNAAADQLDEHADELATTLVREQGRPFANAVREIKLAVLWLRHFAGLELQREILVDSETEWVEKIRHPLGVVAAITPWNAPILLATWKLAPALRTGNTVVLKPSPYTPLTTLAMAELFARVLPAGVFNVVTGPDPLGASLTEHTIPRKVSMTGSTATGRRVAAAAGADLKRVTLELGGNDPAIVLGDVTPSAIADKLFDSALINSGQICFAVKRVYAHADVYDAVVGELARRASDARLGDGFDPQTTHGPLSNKTQLDKVAHYVDDAVARGATAVTGGYVLARPGYFYAPTVLRDAVDGMPVVDEEQFGPVIPVIRFDDVDVVVDRINAQEFGLTASVWSADVDAAAAVAARIDAGQVSVNAHGSGFRPSLPFSGHKHSGIGVENGIEVLSEYTSTTVLVRPQH
ncbi:aldehyde dehydrogenase family protein, partial [Streptomyces olivaceoviridis]|uniref:aldehyde dehydrogenase family protein n=1 Tax=Streptomyces olivaceoviridis TaxID=1921 RepID=UPI0036B15917